MVNIRQAQIQDWQQLAEMRILYHNEVDNFLPLAANWIADIISDTFDNIQNPDRIILVAEIDNQVIGYMICIMFKNIPVFMPYALLEVYINPIHRDGHVFHGLCQIMRKSLKNKGVNIILTTTTRNTNIFKKFGFSHVANLIVAENL